MPDPVDGQWHPFPRHAKTLRDVTSQLEYDVFLISMSRCIGVEFAIGSSMTVNGIGSNRYLSIAESPWMSSTIAYLDRTLP